MKLKLILLTILLMTSVNVIAQERTDKSENIQAVTCRMKYRQYRHYYRAKDYVKDFDDKYSPAGLGVASFFIPGLGQGIADKWGAAAGFFFSDIVLTTGFVLSFEYTFDRYNRLTGCRCHLFDRHCYRSPVTFENMECGGCCPHS